MQFEYWLDIGAMPTALLATNTWPLILSVLKTNATVVVASCGGFPYDINLIQAHKALDMATQACNEGGTIVLLAEVP